MIRTLTLVPALALALAISAPAVATRAEPAYPINPGHWEAKTTFLGLISNTDQWCIQPKDISKFLSGPSNHIYHCTYPINEAGGGKLRFDGTCVDKKGQVIKLKGHGDYTATTLHMQASGSTQMLGMAIGGEADADAHFISSECPANAKAFK